MDKRLQRFLEFARAHAKIQEKGITIKQQEDLVEKAGKAVRACSLSEQHGNELSEVIAGLVADRWWEPKEGDTFSNEGERFLVNRACAHSSEFYVNMAMQLWGDRPAASISWRMISNAAYFHFMQDLRNAIKPVLEEWGVIPGKEEPLEG